MSTESDVPTPRQERYGVGGTNGAYEINLVHTALSDSECHVHRGVLVVLRRRFVLF